MIKNIRKKKQAEILMSDPMVSKYFPESIEFSTEALQDFMSRYDSVYLKPDGGGQGRGIIRVSKEENGMYSLKGYTPTGKDLSIKASNLRAIKEVIQPNAFFEKHRKYVIQQGINSLSQNGQPLGIRVHTQKLKNNWVRSGILGKMVNSEDGIVNRNRGAWAIPIRELLTDYAGMDVNKAIQIENEITTISIKASQLFAEHYPWLDECGIDIGLSQDGQPWIFEVNSNPSIAFFYQLPDKTMARGIFRNRRIKKSLKRLRKNK
ncbi:YheC/YheD family protein [Bacillus sp. 31A1R]|uniref:YheC/YheD family protein n=1 Tax=Robertmurraya mangrovi TaxID=3098077 RepID=A0ABU5J2N8_9BACI|nr:YheC/YheD family protein [Bacillus sp. 31A1R]MDZ5473685.1 YheC/YheD family protein [Bacillus sp. 31A1R]